MKNSEGIWIDSLKSIVKTVFVFTLIVIGFLLLYAWLYFDQANSKNKWATEGVFQTLLQIPYSRSGGYISNALKDGWQDLEPISYEEWMSMECECPDITFNMSDIDWRNFLSITKDDLQRLDEKERKHIICLSADPLYKIKKTKNTMPKHCTNMFNCPATSISINDYILKYPKVLRNIIKIAEKPCHYIKDMPNEDDKENRELYNNINQLRGELYCGKNETPYDDKTYIVIHILDKEGLQSGQLIIPRLDKVGQ